MEMFSTNLGMRLSELLSKCKAIVYNPTTPAETAHIYTFFALPPSQSSCTYPLQSLHAAQAASVMQPSCTYLTGMPDLHARQNCAPIPTGSAVQYGTRRSVHA